MMNETYDSRQTRLMRRFLIIFSLSLIPFTLVLCAFALFLTHSWYALVGLVGLIPSLIVLAHARPMSEKTFQRKLRKIQEKGGKP